MDQPVHVIAEALVCAVKRQTTQDDRPDTIAGKQMSASAIDQPGAAWHTFEDETIRQIQI